MEMHSARQGLAMRLRNDKSHTILVSGASGIVGYGILKSLKGLDCKLIGTTIYEESPANCFADIVEIPPLTSDAEYIPWLIDTIGKYDVDMIIPGIEADMSSWNKNRMQIEKTGTCVLLNTASLIELCLDKWKFYQKLVEYHLPYSIRSSLTPDFEQFKVPFILKPRCGFGAKGVIRVETREVFEKYKEKIGNTLMAQELVGTEDEEYTASAFFDRESNLKACMTMKRKLSKLGFTEIAQVVFEKKIETILRELAAVFLPVGPTNFQFRKHNGELKLLEINPRISSSSSIRKAFGYNESKMCVEFFLQGKDVMQPEIKSGKAIRYTEDYIFYDRDNI